jgi:hypothetical protein
MQTPDNAEPAKVQGDKAKKPRRKHWRGRRYEVLKYVAEVYTVSRAAILAEVPIDTVKWWMRIDPLFRESVEEAQATAIDRIESRHFEAAFGNDTASRIHLLKSHKGHLYAEQTRPEATGGGAKTVNILQINTDPQLVASALKILSGTGLGQPCIDAANTPAPEASDEE